MTFNLGLLGIALLTLASPGLPQGEVSVSEPATVPATAPLLQPNGLAPLSGLPAQVWADRPTAPVLTVVGSGSPELLVYFGPDRPNLAQAAWLESVVVELQAKTKPGKGTIHFLADRGPSVEAAGTHGYPVAAVSSHTEEPAQVLRNSAERFMAEYLTMHPKIVGVVGLTHPTIVQRQVAYIRGSRLSRSAKSPFNLETFLATGLGISHHSLPQVEDTDESWYRLEGTEDWSLGSLDPVQTEPYSEPILKDPMVVPRTDWERANEGKQLEVCSSTKLPQVTAADLLEMLANGAGLRISAGLKVELIGSNLWQVELPLDAPSMQIVPADPKRTYPRDSFAVELDWGPGPPEQEAEEPPLLAYLAWQGPAADHFELLQAAGGRYRFPEGDIPAGVTLRFVIQAPGGAGRLMGLTLRSRLYGKAHVEFVASEIGEGTAEQPAPVDDPNGIVPEGQ